MTCQHAMARSSALRVSIVLALLTACLAPSLAANLPRRPNSLPSGSFATDQELQHLQSQFGLFPLPATRSLCAATEDIPTSGLNLTAEEQALLPAVCWRPHLVPPTPQALPALSGPASDRGLPPGVDCEPVQW